MPNTEALTKLREAVQLRRDLTAKMTELNTIFNGSEAQTISGGKWAALNEHVNELEENLDYATDVDQETFDLLAQDWHKAK